MEAYRQVGSLHRYLVVASILVIAHYVPLFLMLLDIPAGYVLALVGALMGIANGVVHVVGYVKTRSMRGTIGAGMWTGIPLGLAGAVVLYR